MSYEECYQLIIDNFKNKINTDNKLLKIKIFNSLLSWYKDNFEEELKQYCIEKNNLGIINIFKTIEEVCKMDDYKKLNITYKDEEYEKFIKLSNKIFSLVVDKVKNKDFSITDEEYKSYYNEVIGFKEKINSLVMDKYNHHKSECLLDLLFLKKENQVSAFSIRTANLLNK